MIFIKLLSSLERLNNSSRSDAKSHVAYIIRDQSQGVIKLKNMKHLWLRGIHQAQCKLATRYIAYVYQ